MAMKKEENLSSPAQIRKQQRTSGLNSLLSGTSKMVESTYKDISDEEQNLAQNRSIQYNHEIKEETLKDEDDININNLSSIQLITLLISSGQTTTSLKLSKSTERIIDDLVKKLDLENNNIKFNKGMFLNLATLVFAMVLEKLPEGWQEEVIKNSNNMQSVSLNLIDIISKTIKER